MWSIFIAMGSVFTYSNNYVVAFSNKPANSNCCVLKAYDEEHQASYQNCEIGVGCLNKMGFASLVIHNTVFNPCTANCFPENCTCCVDTSKRILCYKYSNQNVEFIPSEIKTYIKNTENMSTTTTFSNTEHKDPIIVDAAEEESLFKHNNTLMENNTEIPMTKKSDLDTTITKVISKRTTPSSTINVTNNITEQEMSSTNSKNIIATTTESSTNENHTAKFNYNYLYILLFIPVALGGGIWYYVVRRNKYEPHNTWKEPTKKQRRLDVTPSWVFSEPEDHSSDEETVISIRS